MTTQEKEINISRLNTAGRQLWDAQKVLEKITQEIQDSNLRVKANDARISVDGVRSLIQDVEKFLWGQIPN